ncbi:C-type lectin domain family 10 member A-like isoform X2 [Pseudorasbora parva]|uniref:C-type lectin domain family 10 member A-like isoform X2 n=1 Tax=Pseudorasbora parva TaxID=51549 RepID=UPI00351EFCE0
MYREDGQTADVIYQNINVISGKKITDHNATGVQSSKLTDSDCVRIRRFRAAAVCLILLCVLLLTALTVVCVMFTRERERLISTNENLTNDRDQLNSTNENLTNDRDQLNSTNSNLKQLNVQLNQEKRELMKLFQEGWIYYQSSFYYLSKKAENWTESRRYCRERGADLIIINNIDKQTFVENMFGGTTVYIGLTDSDATGQWKWVDGSTLTSGFWGSGQPIGGPGYNCVLTVTRDPRWPAYFRWCNVGCQSAFQWICEKSISQFIQP